MNNVAGAQTAGLAWTAALPFVCVRPVIEAGYPTGVVHLDVKGALAGYFMAMAVSFIPDIDHPRSTAGQAIGPVMGAVARLGKHRGMTHSLLAVFAVWMFAGWVLDSSQTTYALATFDPRAMPTLATAAAIGMLAHIWCDLLTVMGVPLLAGLVFLPKKWRRHKFSLLNLRTGSKGEDTYVLLVQITWGLLFLAYIVVYAGPIIAGGTA